MQTREFAERVLFSTSLEEKLTPPGTLQDDLPGLVLTTPDGPGRPEALSLQRDGVRVEFPGTNTPVRDDAHRGLLLHFFANHELLATELMALVLLKFPDAPAEFRAGVLKTLKEEQMHTKLYMKRMADCGVTFGDYPLNGFFWKSVSGMSTPLDYVSRLSLTFEQANLDYSRHFAGVFSRSGDTETAKILDRIYRDEIGHVGYGLEWFRKWKTPGSSDWQAYNRQLTFPLSAVRAKGNAEFNEEGRRDAGLDEEFIRELRVFSHSRGRTPDIYYFNPWAESYIADAHHTPTSTALVLTGDLALLPAFLARTDDLVLVPELPETAFLQKLVDLGFSLPQFEVLGGDGTIVPGSPLIGRKLRSLLPWGWSPDACQILAPLIQHASGTVSNEPTKKALFSKAEHAGFLHGLLRDSPPGFVAPPEIAGHPIVRQDVLTRHLAEIFSSGHKAAVLKAPFSTAGRDRLIIKKETPLTEHHLSWVKKIISCQGSIVAEPWLERLFDFSVQYGMTHEGELRRRGLVHLHNNKKGQFLACTRPVTFTDGMEEPVRRAIYPGADAPKNGKLIRYLEEFLEPSLARLLKNSNYTGPLGVDAFFYLAPDGAVRLKPVSEINPRYTMGRVTLELSRYVMKGRSTHFAIRTLKDLRDGGFPSAASYAMHLETNDPLYHTKRGLSRGSICLNNVRVAKNFFPVLSVR